MPQHTQRWVTIWRIGLALLGCLIIGSILYRYYGVSGTFALEYTFNTESKFISSLTPLGRALNREQNVENGEYYQRVIAEPVYFDVQLPSAYPKIDVTLEYQNPYQPIVELGIQQNDDDANPNFLFQPLENKFVEQSTWPKLENSDYILLQRESTYTSVEEFLAQPPSDAKVGTWHASVTGEFTNSEYVASKDNVVIDQPLIGSQEMYTYIKDQSLAFTITTDSAEVNMIRIYHGTEQIFAQPTNQVNLDNLPEGVYKIIIEVEDDGVIQKIDTPLQKLVFKGKLHLAAAAQLYTQANTVSVIPQTQAGISDIQFYDRALSLGVVGSTYRWTNPIPDTFEKIVVSQGDVVLTADRVMSFSESAWFDPFFGFAPVTAATQPDQLDYILSTTYTFPDEQKGWLSATTTFDLTKVKRADPTQLHFMISAPGLKDQPQGLTVRAIKIAAHKEPITLQNIWQRIQNKL